MFASPPSPTDVFGLGLGEGVGLGAAGVLRPVGIGGRMGLTLDPGRLSEEGDTTTAGSFVSGWGASGVWSNARWSEMEMLYLIYGNTPTNLQLIILQSDVLLCFGDLQTAKIVFINYKIND